MCNCNANFEQPFYKWKIPEINFKSKKCLRQIVTTQSNEFLRLYNFYDKGILLNQGGLYDQPYKYDTAMRLIGEWSALKAAEERDKAEIKKRGQS